MTISLALSLTMALSIAPSQGAVTPDGGVRPATSGPVPGRLALVGGTVHTMTGEDGGLGASARIATVLIENGRIIKIAEGLALAPGVERIDVTGQHVVPGLIDGMVNFDADHDALYVAAGITLVRDVGSDPVRTLAQRAEIARNRVPGPTLLTPGAVLDGDPPSSAEAAVVRSADQVDQAFQTLTKENIDFLCVQVGIGREAWSRALALAGGAGLKVWGPVPRAIGWEDCLVGGQDGILFLDGLLPAAVGWEFVQAPAFDGVVAAMSRRGTMLVPALAASEAMFRVPGMRANPMELLAPIYNGWWGSELGRRRAMMVERALRTGERVHKKRLALVKRLQGAGVHLVPGTGAPHPGLFPGKSLHRELALLEEAGIASIDVLDLATRRAALALGVGESHGRIAPGYVADLLVVREDPRQGVRALREPAIVVVRGRILERTDLIDLLATLAQRMDGAHAAAERELMVEPPEVPSGAIVLTGRLETTVLDQIVAAERFAVVRQPDGQIAIASRIRRRVGIGGKIMEVRILQRLKDRRLDSFLVSSGEGEDELEAEGFWIAGSFRIRRFRHKQSLSTESTSRRIACIDVGSATYALVLGQIAGADQLPIMVLHEGLQPEVADWAMALAGDGTRHLRTHLGTRAFQLTEDGAPKLLEERIGAGREVMRLLEFDAMGGAGLPPLETPAGEGGG